MGARRESNVVTNAPLLVCERACTYIYTYIVYTCVFTNLSSKVLADSKRLNHRVVCRRFLDVGRCVDGTISCDFLFALQAGLDHKAMNELLLLTDFAFYANLCESYLNSIPCEQIKRFAGEERLQIMFTVFEI